MFTVLSLFDGISGAKVALNNLSIPCHYYASEIDKYALEISRKNYPEIVQLGDIKTLDTSSLPKINLLIGGSPCTSLSCAKRQKESGLVKGESVLFWEYVRILKEVKPDYFLLENVASMKPCDKEKISEVLGVTPIMINSALLTAQNRKRLYWTNILGVKQPEDRGIILKDILEKEVPKKYILSGREIDYMHRKTTRGRSHFDFYCDNSDENEKSWPVTRNFHKSVPYNVIKVGILKGLADGKKGNIIFSPEGKSCCITGNSGGRKKHCIELSFRWRRCQNRSL